mgnify:CR=1 FL=1
MVLYLIEIYTSAFNGINFVVAIDQQEVVASSFDKKLETALNKILGNLPFDVPFQVFANPSNQARTLSAFWIFKAINATHLPRMM